MFKKSFILPNMYNIIFLKIGKQCFFFPGLVFRRISPEYWYPGYSSEGVYPNPGTRPGFRRSCCPGSNSYAKVGVDGNISYFKWTVHVVFSDPSNKNF